MRKAVKRGRIKVLCAENRKSPRERVIVGRAVDGKRIMISVMHNPRLNELRRGRAITLRMPVHPGMRKGVVVSRLALTQIEAIALLRLLSDVLFQVVMERRQQTNVG